MRSYAAPARPDGAPTTQELTRLPENKQASMSTPAALLAQQTAKVARPVTAASFDVVNKAVAALPINGQRVAKLPAIVAAAKTKQAAAAPPPPLPALTDEEEEAAVAQLADDGEQFSEIDSDSAAGDDAEASADEEAGPAATGDEEDRAAAAAEGGEFTGDAEQETDPQKLDSDVRSAARAAVESHAFVDIG
jgi:hypothetical protein